jgi:DNA-binding XRE family transcriptional regulator
MNDSTEKIPLHRRTLGRSGIPSKRLVSYADETLLRRQFGARFREARESLGMTQSELATVFGASQGRIAHYETGRGLPRLYEIPPLCRVLQCDPTFLLKFSAD